MPVKNFRLLVLIFGFTLALIAPCLAANEESPSSAMAQSEKADATVTGTIFHVESDGTITIQPLNSAGDPNNRVVIQATPETKITRDENPATLTDLQDGDSISASYDPGTGNAQDIRATMGPTK
jgi:hypothetical protein